MVTCLPGFKHPDVVRSEQEASMKVHLSHRPGSPKTLGFQVSCSWQRTVRDQTKDAPHFPKAPPMAITVAINPDTCTALQKPETPTTLSRSAIGSPSPLPRGRFWPGWKNGLGSGR